VNVNEVFRFVATHAPRVTSPVIAYSVLFGDYDTLPRIPEVAGIDFILFTDCSAPRPPPWKVVFVDSKRYGPRRTGRYFKCLGHHLFPAVGKSVYLDASFMLLRPLDKFISDYEGFRFGLFEHMRHFDISDEAQACIKQGKDAPAVIKDQVARYRAEGLLNPSGCYATGVLMRDLSDPEVAEVNEAWCEEIARGSVRDQISLPYVFWKKAFLPDIFPGDVFYNRYLVPRPHAGASFQQRMRRSAALQAFRLGLLKR